MTYTRAPWSTAFKLFEGVWVNQLGSEVTFIPDPEGHLHGEYCAGAGGLAGRRYPIVGSYQHDPTARTVPMTFFVRWSEAHCVTTWCGHLIPGEERMDTTWLMATEAAVYDEWKSTVIGHDVFHLRP